MGEFYRARPESKSTENLTENREGREAIHKLAIDLVNQRLTELGFEPRQFAFDRVNYFDAKESQMVFREGTEASYKSMSHEIKLRASSDADLPTHIHELIHGMTSDGEQSSTNDNVSHSTQTNYRLRKVGFNSLWAKNGGGESLVADNFLTINEAVTEKLARELALLGQHERTTLEPLFEGVKHSRKQQAIKAFPHLVEYIDSVNTSDTEGKRWRTLNIKKNKEMKESLMRTLDEIKASDGDIALVTSYESLLSKLDSMIHQTEIELNESPWDNPRNVDAIRPYLRELARIQNSYEFGSMFIDEEVYALEIEILDLFITARMREMITESDDETSEELRKSAWKEMQRAFFDGNVMYLRKFDRYFGLGTLKKLEDFGSLPSKEKEDFIADLKQKLT